MTNAYLLSTGRMLSPGAPAADGYSPSEPDVPDHRSKEVANENFRNIKGLMAMVPGAKKVRG